MGSKTKKGAINQSQNLCKESKRLRATTSAIAKLEEW